MLKLLIADDEEQVLNMLSIFIDWKKMGIQLIGTCTNGIDAYHMIIDSCPDIVLTDIKMPGLTGIELIEKVKLADIDTEFVILSGFGEFEYARKAMQYGVRHYLLKPCNENQITEIMEDVKKACYQKRESFEKKDRLTKVLESYVIENLFFECLSQHEELENIKLAYEPVVDFYTLDYEVCYFHYLEEQKLAQYMGILKQKLAQIHPALCCYMLYVSYTLIVFFPGFDAFYETLDMACTQIAGEYGLQYQRNSYDTLSDLLTVLIHKLIRYEVIHFICNEHHHLIYNHKALTLNIKNYIDRLVESDPSKHSLILAELGKRMNSIQDMDLLKILLSNMILQLYSRLKATANFVQIMPFIERLNNCVTSRELHEAICQKINLLFSESADKLSSSQDCIEKMIRYTNIHLADPTISLKKLAQSYLYMNPDYVGKQFQKRTGMKFSTYLSSIRMEKAKELLRENGSERIYIIAEQVGCENNPQYFSQLFKKYTGMTPTQYAKKYQAKNEEV